MSETALPLIEYFLRQDYKTCDKYNKDVNGGPVVTREIEAFVNSAENVAVSIFRF